MNDTVNYKNRGETGYQEDDYSCLAWTSGWICVILGNWKEKITCPLLYSLSRHFASLPLIYYRYSGICPQGVAGHGERCKVHFCSLVRTCVGPGGHQPKGPGQFYCPVAFQPMKDMVSRVLGRGLGVFQDGWSSVLILCMCRVCDCKDCRHSPPTLSRSVLSVTEPQGRQTHLPEIQTLGPDAYLPLLQ